MPNSTPDAALLSLSSVLMAFELSSDAVVVTDSEHRILYTNRSSEIIFGTNRDDLPGLILSDLLHPLSADHHTIVPLPGYNLTEIGESFTSQIPQTVRTISNTLLPLDIKVTKVCEGYIYYFTSLSTIREIERQVLLQANLLDHVSESLIATDREGTILYWNDAAKLLYGWEAKEVIGKNVNDVVVPLERRDTAKQTFRELAVNGTMKGEFSEIRKDGSTFLSHVHLSEVRDWQNRRIGFIGLSHDLTAEQAAQVQLKHSISLLQATLQATEDGILVVDNRGRISTWNEQFLRMWHIPEDTTATESGEAALRVALGQLVDPGAFLAKVHELYASPEAESFDVITFNDGRIFERTSRPQLIDGISAGRVWCFRDVTARYSDQYELAEQKSLYESLINAQSDMGEGFVIASPSKIFFSNAAVETITGYTKQELNDFKSILDFIAPEERVELSQRLERRLRGEPVPDHYETRILHKNGKVIDVELAVKLRSSGDGSQLVIILRDITQRKEIERSLISSETKFRTVVDNLGEAIVITDIEDRILYLNARLEELSGYSTAECIGHVGHELMLHEGEWSKATKRLESRKLGTRETYELLFKRKNGELRWCSVNAVPFYNLEGDIVGTVGAITDIHDKKQKEIELHRAEERFRFMTLATSDVVYDWVFDTNEIWWNEAFARLLQLNPNERIDLEAWSKRVHPEDRERVMLGLQNATTGKNQVWSEEYRLRRNDGSYAYIIDRGYLIFDERDTPVRMIGAMMDLTERKHSENEIQKAAANTSAIIENTSDAILSLDKDLNLVTFNSSFQEMFSLHNGVDPYPGMKLEEYFLRHEHNLWRSIFDRVLSGEHFSIERRRSIGGMDERIFEMSFNPIRENNEVVGFAIFDKDITERKEADEALKRSKANLHALIENTSDAIWSIDTDQRLITFNSTFRMMFAASFGIDPVEGMDLMELTERADHAFWKVTYARALSGEQFTMEHSSQLHGVSYFFEVSFCPIVTDQNLTGVTIFTRNVTERKQMEHQLIAEKERAEEMSRLKSSFLANMSHEIRTPMTAILGFASIIREHARSTELDSYANTIERSGTRLLATINGILDLAKIEANKIDLRNQLLDVHTEIEKTAEFYRPLALSKGLTLELSSQLNTTILADEHYLGQILTNLIGNALKFTQTGSIRIEQDSDHENVIIRVIDTGIGISADFLPHIFDEFKQESGGYARVYEGTGLGLTITKRLVQLMNGSIEAESQLGVGSRFTLRFPHAQTMKTVTNNNEPTSTGAGHEKPQQTVLPRVLLVEDTADTAEMIRIFMRGICHLDLAHSAEEALEYIDRHTTFDLLLMDVNLGQGPSGLEVAREIRSKDPYRETPIIALTAFAMQGDRESAIAAGCTDYLSKPFTKAELLKKVNQFLEK